MLNLDLFENKKLEDGFINKFIEELKSILNNSTTKDINEENIVLDEYNLYERKKNILDNISRKGNDLAWIMDDNSVCISESGDGGPVSISELDLPDGVHAGEVYEKVDGEYVYNSDITMKLRGWHKNLNGEVNGRK